MNDDTYKEKFIAFLEGIEMQNIPDFIELPVEDIRVVSTIFKTVTNNSKTHDLLSDLKKLDALFRRPN